ncbi:hypothetical protein P3X46_009895 [Hevea brasiliensis]|uniref:rRNA N-glycosylase n=2 Tax=Hevea brasiliensis TaxID=3981 RepID=A0A6A6N674_HEVBR|nr:ribosome-inactivating protein gelonin [Hevea brasiliensis]KAF2321671.1 hypothetical protein GH714_001048 [Hevea brasiliensis]KAJ9177973.1 hypothetical protein P3X46_009895 [Hevea brasiliensis]
MKVALWIVVATWISWTIVFGTARVYPLTANDDYTLGVFPTASFSTKDATATSYSTFLSDLRGKLGSGNSNGIPVLPATVAQDKQYLLVELTNSQNYKVTVALNLINIYVVAYKAGSKAFFFSDAPDKATDYLFKDKDTNQIKLKFTGSYVDLQKNGADRLKTNLGVLALDDSIFTLNKYDNTQPTKIAGPLVVTIQMVAEAARFTYIERKVLSNFAQRFLPLEDVTSRENKWKSLSTGIQKADKNGNFPTPVQLKNSDGSANVVSTVKQAKPDMGILLYVANKNSKPSLEQTQSSFWLSTLIQNY